MHKTANLLSLAPTVETRYITPVSVPMRAQTRGTCWPSYRNTAATVSLGRAAAERRSMYYASAAGLRPTQKISFKKNSY